MKHPRARLAILLAAIALAPGCNAVQGLTEDIGDASRSMQLSFTGDDPDSPAND